MPNYKSHRPLPYKETQHHERYRNIMPDQLEMWIFQQRNHILLTSRKIVIQTNYFISFF